MQTLRHSLSFTLQSWLSNYIFSVCQTFIAKPWGLLPGADAAALAPSAQDQTQATSAPTAATSSTLPAGTQADAHVNRHQAGDTPTESTPIDEDDLTDDDEADTPVATSWQSSHWTLATGASLEAIGLVALAYGLWQWNKNRSSDHHRVPSTDAATAQVDHRNAAGEQPESIELLAYPEKESAPGDDWQQQMVRHRQQGHENVLSSPTPSSVVDMTSILIFSGLTMAGGGVLLYLWRNAPETQEDPADMDLGESGPLPTALVSAIDQAEIALANLDISVIFTDMEVSDDLAVMTRERRSVSETPYIRTLMKKFLRSSATDTETRNLFLKIKKTAKKKIPAKVPQAHRGVYLLLKCLLVMWMMQKQAGPKGDRNQCLAYLKQGVMGVLKSVKNPKHQAIINRYLDLFSNAPDDGERAREDVRTKSQSISVVNGMLSFQNKTVDMAIGEAIQQAYEQIKPINDPILTPSVFIDQFVNQQIAEWKAKTGSQAPLTASTRVKVRLKPSITTFETIGTNIPPPDVTKTFTITEIATGLYRHECAQVRDEIDQPYRINFVEYKDLLSSLETDALQTAIRQALKVYQSDPGNKERLTQFFRTRLVTRCLHYLGRQDAMPAVKRAIYDLLLEKVQACAVNFHGTPITGAFYLPCGKIGGMLFSIDEPLYFLAIHAEPFLQITTPLDMSRIIRFSDTPAFRKWVFAHISRFQYLQYGDDARAFTIRSRGSPLPGNLDAQEHYGPYLDVPFTISEPMPLPALIEHLHSSLMDRLESDVDTTVWSRAERRSIVLLEAVKSLLSITSVITGVALPGTGALLTKVLGVLALLAMDIGTIAASLAQAAITDDPKHRDQYIEEATSDSLFVALGLCIELRSTLPPRPGPSLADIVTATKFYQAMRRTVQKAAPNKLKKVLEQLKKPPEPPLPAKPGAIKSANDAPKRAGGAEPAVRPRPRRPGGGQIPGPPYIYPASPDFTELRISPTFKGKMVPGDQVGYRTLGDSNYVQFLTCNAQNAPADSRRLVITAHGGYLDSDRLRNVVDIPAGVTVNFLTPHNTYLRDPSLDFLLNYTSVDKPRVYVKLRRDKLPEVDFTVQGRRKRKKWREDRSYDPEDIHHTHGLPTGAIDYQHYQYEWESPEYIAETLLTNRVVTSTNPEQLTDIIAVNGNIASVADAWRLSPYVAPPDISPIDLMPTGVNKVLKMHASGQLVNAAGRPYEDFVFAHCRVNFAISKKFLSTYDMTDKTGDLVRSAKFASIVVETTVRRDPTTGKMTATEQVVGLLAHMGMLTNRNRSLDAPATIPPMPSIGQPSSAPTTRR